MTSRAWPWIEYIDIEESTKDNGAGFSKVDFALNCSVSSTHETKPKKRIKFTEKNRIFTGFLKPTKQWTIKSYSRRSLFTKPTNNRDI